jgi:hypothetical protein
VSANENLGNTFGAPLYVKPAIPFLYLFNVLRVFKSSPFWLELDFGEKEKSDEDNS